MKKTIISIVLIFALITVCLCPVYAYNVGDVVNSVLYTDIRAYIDGIEIPAYNVDGYMAVVAEDLAGYGFYVYWNPSAKSLSVTRGEDIPVKPVTATVGGAHKIGDKIGNVYYTDIKTYVDGELVTSYNIGGRTIIYFRELDRWGSYFYDNTQRATFVYLDKTVETTPETDAETTPYTPTQPTIEPTSFDASVRRTLQPSSVDDNYTLAAKVALLAILDFQPNVSLYEYGVTNTDRLLGLIYNYLYGETVHTVFAIADPIEFKFFDGITTTWTRGNILDSIDLSYLFTRSQWHKILSSFTKEQLTTVFGFMNENYYHYQADTWLKLFDKYSYDMLFFIFSTASPHDTYNVDILDISLMESLYGTANMPILALKADMTAIEKLHYLHDYMIATYSYDTSETIHYPSVMLMQNKGVCQAYSLLYKYWLDRLGIENELITTSDHQWNMVCIGGEWYHIDVTWDDPVPDGNLLHENFLRSDSGIRSTGHSSWTSTHTASSTIYDNYIWD